MAAVAAARVPVPGAAEPATPTSGIGRQLDAGVGVLRGARSEIRRQMREQRRLRLAVLVGVSLLVLGALPLWFGVRAAARDPVFGALDALPVPQWAATEPVDGVSGSRWCLFDCRFRERTLHSQRDAEQTGQVYRDALAAEGWQSWQVDLCPERPVEGHYSCWRRDELTLDLWVRAPACPITSTETDEPAAEADRSAPPQPAAECGGSLVTFKVRNAIDDERTGPQPSTDPSLTGEDPDPVFTDDPLLDPTPTPS